MQGSGESNSQKALALAAFLSEAQKSIDKHDWPTAQLLLRKAIHIDKDNKEGLGLLQTVLLRSQRGVQDHFSILFDECSTETDRFKSVEVLVSLLQEPRNGNFNVNEAQVYIADLFGIVFEYQTTLDEKIEKLSLSDKTRKASSRIYNGVLVILDKLASNPENGQAFMNAISEWTTQMFSELFSAQSMSYFVSKLIIMRKIAIAADSKCNSETRKELFRRVGEYFHTILFDQLPKENQDRLIHSIFTIITSTTHFIAIYKDKKLFRRLVEQCISHESLPLILSHLSEKPEMKLNFSVISDIIYDCFQYDHGKGDNYRRKHINGNGALVLLSAVYSVSHELGLALLTENVLAELGAILDSDQDPLLLTALDTLLTLSADIAGRKNVVSFVPQLEHLSKSSDQENVKALAVSVLVKLEASKEPRNEFQNSIESSESIQAHQLSQLMSKLSVIPDTTSIALPILEALSHLSANVGIKELLCNTKTYLKSLIQVGRTENATVQFAVATIFANVTRYPESNSAEKEQLKALRALASGGTSQTGPRDVRYDATYVDKRCQTLIENGAVEVLVSLASSKSTLVLDTTSQIFLNLVTRPEHRGAVVQQGVKTLLVLLSKSSDPGKVLATQAVAKIAISMDPRLAFPGQRSMMLVQPLIRMCQGVNTLQQFEGLLALTNLASMDTPPLRKSIHSSQGLRVMLDLLLSDHLLVQQAATEAICNMAYDPDVFMQLAQDKIRLRIFLALCDAENFSTKRAATGLLAVLSSHPDVCTALLEYKSDGSEEVRAVPIFHVLLSENNDELTMRVIEIIKNLSQLGVESCRLLMPLKENIQKLLHHKHDSIATVSVFVLNCFKLAYDQ